MALNAESLKEITLKKRFFGGYRIAQVDDLLAEVGDSMQEQERTLAAATAELQQARERIRQLEQMEKQLMSTLERTEGASKEHIEQAGRQAEMIVAEAHVKAEQLLSEARMQSEQTLRQAKAEELLRKEKIRQQARQLKLYYHEVNTRAEKMSGEMMEIARKMQEDLGKLKLRNKGNGQVEEESAADSESFFDRVNR